MARENRGAADAAADHLLVYDSADASAVAAAAANAPAAAGAGAPAGPSAAQFAAADLSELTAPQFVDFMEEKGQMGLPSDTVFFLVTEGIDRVKDLADFSDALLENVAKNGRHLKKNVSAMSLHRLKVAAQAVRFYIAVWQPITFDNINWSLVLKNFEKQ